MKKVILTAILILVGGMFAAAYAQAPGRGGTSALFEVKNGQTKTIPGSKAKVKFLSVVEDSRCPEGTQCIWAGNARVKLRVTSGRKSKIFDVNTGKGDDRYIFEHCEIKLVKVDPHPKAGEHIRQKDYVVTLTAIPPGSAGKG